MTEQENPLEHVVQHPLIERTASPGVLTPDGKITLFSDQIAMIEAGDNVASSTDAVVA